MNTISYSEKVKGWTSFHTFMPDWISKLNNRLYTIKDGQLWKHNDEDNPVRNNFYGVQHSSKITTVVNEANAEDKIFKTLVLEGNAPWDVVLETNLTDGTIASKEFVARESRWFAHTRRNEDATDFHGNTVQGIGVIISSSGLDITFANPTSLVNVGDVLYQLNAGVNEVIGTITDINGSTITVNAITTSPVNGYYSFAMKHARVEGADMRGYYMEVTLENGDVTPVELFAINSNIVRSGVNINQRQ